MSDQEQFLDVIDRDEAESRFHAALTLRPLGMEQIPLAAALGRVLAETVIARVDVPSFDRSNFDGYAVHASGTFGATELEPRHLRLRPEVLEAGRVATIELMSDEAIAIATGGMIPRGADAIVMVEHTEIADENIVIRRAVSPGFGVTFAGTDIACGETVMRKGTVLTSRETGVLAAIGVDRVSVWRRPRAAIISTGNEVVAPGTAISPGQVFDSNSQVLADSVRELGGQPDFYGIVRDDLPALRKMLGQALAESDLVLLSGGTSKGQGDVCYRAVAELPNPGIVAHGVALKPGKPLCLAVTDGKPVVVLPGFPTSAIFTFQEFVAPVIRMLAGRSTELRETVDATMAVKVNSEIGRTEYLLVSLVETEQGLSAFPLGKGSGSVTAFSRADGFVTIPRHTEIVEVGRRVDVQRMGHDLRMADLIVIGSHCVGLDYLLTELQQRGVSSKLLTVGSSAGLLAAKRGECDLAGIHLLDAASGQYNRPFLTDSVDLIDGYGRLQGIAYRPGDERFEGRSLADILSQLTESNDRATDGRSRVRMVNRNQGSGTRILLDRLLGGVKPVGYAVQPGNHNAVAAAILQGRADWGMTIESIAREAGLRFVPVQEERYDFVTPKARRDRPAVRSFLDLLTAAAVRQRLAAMGFHLTLSEASPAASG